MADQELRTVELYDDFYRDSFGKIIVFIIGIVVAIALLVALSVYLYLNKPAPVVFPVDAEWRIQPPVPLDKAYLSDADVLQWVSNVIPNAFIFDFNNYNEQLEKASQHFTSDGWQVFLDQLNIYANYNTVQSGKLFINAEPTGAPSLVNSGLLSGRFGWWVQIPIELTYAGANPPPTRNLTLQVLVVRVSTLNNLTGVGINNVVVTKGAINQPGGKS